MTLPLASLKALGVVLPLVVALLWSARAWHEEVERTLADGMGKAALVAQYADRMVQTQLVLHSAAAARAARETPEFLRSVEFHRFLAETEAAQRVSSGVLVMDVEGRLVASSRAFPLEEMTFSRSYVAEVGAGQPIAIDRMTILPSAEDAIVVASPFSAPGFTGLIVSAIPAEGMRRFLRETAPAPLESASLLRSDGTLLIRHDLTPPTVLPPDADAMRAVAAARQGGYRTVALSDGVERYYAFDSIQDLPISAHVGAPVSDVRFRFVLDLLPFWALMLSIAVFSVLLVRQIERQVTARMQAREMGQLAEQRADLLLEMNHRVKNNLAMIMALIASHKRDRRTIDPDEMTARVLAISEVHDLMYRSDQASPVDFGEVITRLCGSPAILPPERNLTSVCDVEEGVLLDPRSATSLVLAVAELMTNAVKHGFAGRSSGTITIRLRTCTTGIELEVRDDGVGLPEDPDRASGLRLVRAFVMQVGGRLEAYNDNGAVFRIRFPPDMSAP